MTVLCQLHGPCRARKRVWACADSENRRTYASAQSVQGLYCPITETLDITECVNGEQMLGGFFAHAQDDLNLRICVFSKIRIVFYV